MNETSSRRRWPRGKIVLLSLIAVAISLAVYAVAIEPDRLIVRETTIKLIPCPAELNGLRVAAISDIHAGSPHITIEKIRRMVEMTNSQQPDLILLAGDFVIQDVIGGSFIEPETLAVELKTLKAEGGVFATLGNHDWWYNAARVRNPLELAGIRVLDNQAVKIELKGRSFWLAGFADEWEGNPKINETLKHIADDSPIIAFTHNPDLFPAVPKRVSLTIAGHTHGGQVALPLIGRPIIPSNFGQRFAIGHIIEDGKHLFVTPGIGTSIIPVRFGVPPEISLLTIN
ncbi:MAG: metallophosphoesterase [Blastocatellales bacterium]